MHHVTLCACSFSTCDLLRVLLHILWWRQVRQIASVTCCDGYRPGGRAGLKWSQPVWVCTCCFRALCCSRKEDNHNAKPSRIVETTDSWFWVCGINKHISFEGKGGSCQPGSHPSFLHFYYAKFILKWEETALKINSILVCKVICCA